MYRLKPKNQIPDEITRYGEHGKITVSKYDLLQIFKDDWWYNCRKLEFGVWFENEVPIVKMYPECFDKI